MELTMNNLKDTQNNRPLEPTELAVLIKVFREMRQWSQEQLAEISGINTRTVQRVEQGVPASLDTRRALARAFDFEDIDFFNKHFTIPSEEQVAVEKEKFENEHITLQAYPLTTGKQLAKLAETCSMDFSEPAFELNRKADEAFAMLVDYFREYRDCAYDYNEMQKLEIYDGIQSHIDTLRGLGVSMRYATRKINIKWGSDKNSQPMRVTVLYLVGFPVGKESDQFTTRKSAGIRL